MNTRRLLQRIIDVTLVVLLLIGCSTPRPSLSGLAVTHEDIKALMPTLGALYGPPTDSTDEDEVPCIDAQEEFARSFKSVLLGSGIIVILCRFADSNESSEEVEQYLQGALLLSEGTEIGLDMPGAFSGNAAMWTEPGGTTLSFNQEEVFVMLVMSSIPEVENERLGSFLIALGLLQQSRLEDGGYR